MQLFNTLTRRKQTLQPLRKEEVRVYTCGPTVYDHIHIGNLRAFIIADLLIRSLRTCDYGVRWLMNITDVDDKTIQRSREEFPEDEPQAALRHLTRRYEKVFLDDISSVGIDTDSMKLVRATEHIDDMQTMMTAILDRGWAYLKPDGVYFDVRKYAAAQQYGRLSKVELSQSQQRIDNDEYDKEQAQDFALWKAAAAGEPSWDYEYEDQTIAGRPGWHIECSAMSTKYLGQPFDIHTGGVDLEFPHHENEIAQTRAATDSELANVFIHSEHLLVEGRKMAKSLDNFYTLRDIKKRGFHPMSFRLLILGAHYRTQMNFSWESLQAAQTTLQTLYMMADRQFSDNALSGEGDEQFLERTREAHQQLLEVISDDLNTPEALKIMLAYADYINEHPLPSGVHQQFCQLLEIFESLSGLGLLERTDITQDQKQQLNERNRTRQTGDFEAADTIRVELRAAGIELNDTLAGTYWYRRLDSD